MSLLSYQLQIKRYQKELGLSDRDFNKLYFKYSGLNLIKHLQILNSAPSATGWYGTLEIKNSSISETDMHLYSIKRSDTNDEVVIDTILGAGDPIYVPVPIGTRLANPLTQLKIYWYSTGGNYINTIESSTGVTAESYDSGFDLNQTAVKGNFSVNSGFYDDQAIRIVIKIYS